MPRFEPPSSFRLYYGIAELQSEFSDSLTCMEANHLVRRALILRLIDQVSSRLPLRSGGAVPNPRTASERAASSMEEVFVG